MASQNKKNNEKEEKKEKPTRSFAASHIHQVS